MILGISNIIKIVLSQNTLSLVLITLCCAHQVVSYHNISTGSKQVLSGYGKHHFHLTAANNDKDVMKDSPVKSSGNYQQLF